MFKNRIASSLEDSRDELAGSFHLQEAQDRFACQGIQNLRAEIFRGDTASPAGTILRIPAATILGGSGWYCILRAFYNGILPCFLGGFESRLFSIISKASIILGLVSEG